MADLYKTGNLGVNAASHNDTQTYKPIQILPEYDGVYDTKYDWWQATISIEGMGQWRWHDIDNDKFRVGEWRKETDIGVFLEWLQGELPFADQRLGGGRNGYERSCAFVCGDTTDCLVQWGGVNPDPNITATGAKAPALQALITSRFPKGRISRVDSAFDSLSGTTAFQEAAAWLEARADKAGVNYRWIRNSDPSIGDTLYVGSPNSRVMIRLYEKGKQMGYKAGDWWRAEVQLKPSSRDKASTYDYSPGMVWSASRITRDFMEYLTGQKLQAGAFGVAAPTKDLDTKAAWLVKQYHNTLRDLLQDSGGSWLALGAKLDGMAESMGLPRLSEPEAGERG